MTGLNPAAWYVNLFVAIVVAMVFMPIWLAWFFTREARKQKRNHATDEPQDPARFEEGYQRWLTQRETDQIALEKERVRVLNLSQKAFARFVADLPSVLSRMEYFLGLGERQLPNGSLQFFWDTISKLEGMLFEGIPDKVFEIKKKAGAGPAVEQVETLEREATRFAGACRASWRALKG